MSKIPQIYQLQWKYSNITNNYKSNIITLSMKKYKEKPTQQYFGFAVFNHMTFIKNTVIPLYLPAKPYMHTHRHMKITLHDEHLQHCINILITGNYFNPHINCMQIFQPDCTIRYCLQISIWVKSSRDINMLVSHQLPSGKVRLWRQWLVHKTACQIHISHCI